jgi:hypothetical protein
MPVLNFRTIRTAENHPLILNNAGVLAHTPCFINENGCFIKNKLMPYIEIQYLVKLLSYSHKKVCNIFIHYKSIRYVQ